MTDLSVSLVELGSLVWNETLGLPLEPAADVEPADTRTVEGHVHISGVWQGTLVLQCSYALAVQAARKMFRLGDQEPLLEDVQDTVGELTNMLGGNVKALMSDDGCSLSLPVVVEGTDYRVRVPRSRVLARNAFRSEGAPMVVTLLEASG